MILGGQTSPQHLLPQMASCSPLPSGLCLPFPRMLLLASAVTVLWFPFSWQTKILSFLLDPKTYSLSSNKSNGL